MPCALLAGLKYSLDTLGRVKEWSLLFWIQSSEHGSCSLGGVKTGVCVVGAELVHGLCWFGRS